LHSASKNGEKYGVHRMSGERGNGIGESAALLNQQRAHHETGPDVNGNPEIAPPAVDPQRRAARVSAPINIGVRII
jgi:hypothetical protein